MKLAIAGRAVGPDHPVFLQVEVGVTHGGSFDRARALVDAAKTAGADAVKFIVTDPDKIMATREVPFTFDTATGPVTRPIYDLLAETRLSFGDWRALRDYCRYRDIIFFATADHLDAVDMLYDLDVPAYKLCAWDVAYLPLVRHMIATGKPVLADIGTATAEEIAAVRQTLGDHPHLLLHAPHPFTPGDWAMARLPTLRGFSSPGRDTWCDFVALGRGACLIEKRLTLDRAELTGHHHFQSLTPDELTAWVANMRLADLSLRQDRRVASPEAWAERRKWDRNAEGLRS